MMSHVYLTLRGTSKRRVAAVGVSEGKTRAFEICSAARGGALSQPTRIRRRLFLALLTCGMLLFSQHCSCGTVFFLGVPALCFLDCIGLVSVLVFEY